MTNEITQVNAKSGNVWSNLHRQQMDHPRNHAQKEPSWQGVALGSTQSTLQMQHALQ